MKTEKKTFSQIISSLFILVLIVSVAVWFVFAVTDAGKRHNDKELYNLESSLRRAAAACYAIEGAYPQSLEYLIEHYGIQIDYNRYNVFYNVFAENLMPDITVVEQK